MRSSVTACVIPAMGVRPPFRTLVAVRAMAPVAGIPPNSGDAMLAIPCATSSMFERWRPPIIPSATTAERSDSTAPSNAIVNAAPINPGIWWNVTAGREGAGSAALMTPKRLPIVSTGRCSSCTPPVVPTSATNGLGMRPVGPGPKQSRARVRGDPPPRGGVQDPKAGTANRAGRAADLYARAAQGGDEESRDDRGEQPALGAYPARNREGDGERERHDPNDDPRAQIGEKLLISAL